MMTAQQVYERECLPDSILEQTIRECFEITDRALLGIVDRLEEIFYNHRTEMEPEGSIIRISLPKIGRVVNVEVETKRPLLRHIIARVATLIHERRPTPEGFQPYGGGGYLPSTTEDGRGAYIIYGNSQQTGVWLKSTPA